MLSDEVLAEIPTQAYSSEKGFAPKTRVQRNKVNQKNKKETSSKKISKVKNDLENGI